MSDYENEQQIITMEDEDGEVFRFRVLDRLAWKGNRYAVVTQEPLPSDDPLDEEDAPDEDEYEEDESVMIYRLQDDGQGGESFEPVEDEDELQDVFDMFRVAWDEYEFCDAE